MTHQLNNYRFPEVETISGSPKVTLILGTDRHIGEASGEHETRVGIVPEQVTDLYAFLRHAGTAPEFYVVSGAGEAAGYPDSDYQQAGCKIVDEVNLGELQTAPDVFHALKEPCPYERAVPGPYLRIGALHTGIAAEENVGLTALLEAQQVCGVFDGSSVGGCSCVHYPPTPQVPIRHAMSQIAGEIAAKVILETARERGLNGHFVVCGGGVVGESAANYLAANSSARIVIIEALKDRRDELTARFSSNPTVEIKAPTGERIAAVILEGCAGIALSPFRSNSKTPKVVLVNELITMQAGAAIVDVSADEGGAIGLPAEKNSDDVSASIADLRLDFRYIADTHLPRYEPQRASILHGEGVLPYLAVLLYLCGKHGGPEKALQEILQATELDLNPSYLQTLLVDLNNGLAFARTVAPLLLVRDIVKEPADLLPPLQQAFLGVFDIEQSGTQEPRLAGLLSKGTG